MGAAGWLGKAALKEILKLSPQIVETATQVFRSIRKKDDGVAAGPVADRVAELEQLYARQAEAVAALAGHVESLTRVVDRLRRRLLVATAVAAAAVLAVLALLIFR